jgi:hypothetical protein
MADRDTDSAAKEDAEFGRQQRQLSDDLEDGHVREEDRKKIPKPPTDPNLVSDDP